LGFLNYNKRVTEEVKIGSRRRRLSLRGEEVFIGPTSHHGKEFPRKKVFP